MDELMRRIRAARPPRDYDDLGALRDSLLRQYPEWKAMADSGALDAMSWLEGADRLLQRIDEIKHGKSGKKRKSPTLAEFDKPGVVWGNA
jgi:hypothetical protein